jgi:hypothetical protein
MKSGGLFFWQFPRTPSYAERGREAECDRDGRLPVCRPKGLLPVYPGAQHGEFMIEERVIDPLVPFGEEGVRNHFAARGRELVHLVFSVCLVCLVRRMRETSQPRAPDRLLLDHPPSPTSHNAPTSSAE